MLAPQLTPYAKVRDREMADRKSTVIKAQRLIDGTGAPPKADVHRQSHLRDWPPRFGRNTPACSTDGTWDHIAIAIDWARSRDMVADGIEGVHETVRRRIRRGANVIKVGLSKASTTCSIHAATTP
jgi:hypothetical protein